MELRRAERVVTHLLGRSHHVNGRLPSSSNRDGERGRSGSHESLGTAHDETNGSITIGDTRRPQMHDGWCSLCGTHEKAKKATMQRMRASIVAEEREGGGCKSSPARKWKLKGNLSETEITESLMNSGQSFAIRGKTARFSLHRTECAPAATRPAVVEGSGRRRRRGSI